MRVDILQVGGVALALEIAANEYVMRRQERKSRTGLSSNEEKTVFAASKLLSRRAAHPTKK